MIMKLKILTSLLLAVLTASPVLAASADDDGNLDEFQTRFGSEWRQIRHDAKRNITTWMRQEDGKTFRSFKVQAELEGFRFVFSAELQGQQLAAHVQQRRSRAH